MPPGDQTKDQEQRQGAVTTLASELFALAMRRDRLPHLWSECEDGLRKTWVLEAQRIWRQLGPLAERSGYERGLAEGLRRANDPMWDRCPAIGPAGDRCCRYLHDEGDHAYAEPSDG